MSEPILGNTSRHCRTCGRPLPEDKALWCDEECCDREKEERTKKELAPGVEQTMEFDGIAAAARRAFDEIVRPRHYNTGRIEVWDFIVDQELGYLAGNVIKYTCRYRHKGTPLKDLKKARAYLERLIRAEEERDAKEPSV